MRFKKASSYIVGTELADVLHRLMQILPCLVIGLLILSHLRIELLQYLSLLHIKRLVVIGITQ